MLTITTRQVQALLRAKKQKQNTMKTDDPYAGVSSALVGTSAQFLAWRSRSYLQIAHTLMMYNMILALTLSGPA